MLFLTDDGPINCDDARHEVRDMRTGRPRSPERLAGEDSLIREMVRRWVASKRRHAQDSSRSTPRQDTKMRSRFNANALFQRSADSRDHGLAFAEHMAERKMSPLDFWRKKLCDASRTASRHAFDSAGDHEAALKHLQRMENHIAVRGGTDEFDPVYLARCFKAMLAAMGSKDDGAEDDEPRRSEEDDRTAEERYRAATGKPSVGKDRRAHDSAPFSADALFQRGER